ncbi:recombinase family protein [Kluyvera genomosp. 2]|uniref:recombinase family protein n=1 Tax=Kluyvera genomosp. 2 TaxID=2774054 RepID=UPI002FD7ECE4
MSRTFAYCRVSRNELITSNQVLAIQNAGYKVTPSRVIEETVSGSVAAMDREKFSNLVNNKLEEGDTLIVLKLDRLGRDNIDVQKTVKLLLERGIKLICLDLPVADLSKPEGKLMLQLFATFAEFERNRIIERTQQGLERAKAEGKVFGRPKADTAAIQRLKASGMSQSKVAAELSIGIATVKRHWNV